MDVSLTFAEYQGLGGRLASDEFNALLPYAQDLVARECWPRAAETDAQAAAWKRAVARVVDVDSAWGGTHGAASGGSWTVGRVSESAPSSSSDGSSFDADARAAIRSALVGTGLLCKVIA